MKYNIGDIVNYTDEYDLAKRKGVSFVGLIIGYNKEADAHLLLIIERISTHSKSLGWSSVYNSYGNNYDELTKLDKVTLIPLDLLEELISQYSIVGLNYFWWEESDSHMILRNPGDYALQIVISQIEKELNKKSKPKKTKTKT